MRKHVGESPVTPVATAVAPAPLPIQELATAYITSELPEQPIEHIFEGSRSAGDRWMAASTGEQTLLLAFDYPQRIRRVVLVIEEPDTARTQELELAVSTDGGQTFRQLIRQEYTFSPPGTTTEREDWTVETEPATHLRLRIKPDKGGRPAFATMTSLILY